MKDDLPFYRELLIPGVNGAFFYKFGLDVNAGDHMRVNEAKSQIELCGRPLLKKSELNTDWQSKVRERTHDIIKRHYKK